MKRHDLTVDIIARQIAALLADYPELAEDADLFLGMVEGETDAIEVMRELVSEYLEARAMKTALDDVIDRHKDRASRYANRADKIRELISKVMNASDRAKFELPEATLSLVAGRSSTVITDETAIPESFMRVVKSPDKAAITAALKEGKNVPGASLTNSPPSLMIRIA